MAGYVSRILHFEFDCERCKWSDFIFNMLLLWRRQVCNWLIELGLHVTALSLEPFNGILLHWEGFSFLLVLCDSWSEVYLWVRRKITLEERIIWCKIDQGCGYLHLQFFVKAPRILSFNNGFYLAYAHYSKFISKKNPKCQNFPAHLLLQAGNSMHVELRYNPEQIFH